MPALLVIDDDELTLDCFRFLFPRGEAAVRTAATAAEGLRLFTEQRPDAVVCDIRLPDMSGLDLFRRLHEVDPKVPVILMTGHGSATTAIEAMRLGAYEYVLKPLDTDALSDLIGRAFQISRLMRVPAVVAASPGEDQSADILIGRCPPMQDVYKAIGRVAPQDVTTLILGESGTGKELAARAIYHYSRRAAGPFLAVNCAAIPETLLESELFGHEKGAFTGADRRRIGKFEQCSGGTLFLDEIGDMTPLTQAKILRVLQDQQFERVGGNEPIRTDVRVIAATNRDLETLVGQGKFRGDLYYRLNVYAIRMPPLRERGEDLPLLTEHFLRLFNREFGKSVRAASPEVLEAFRRYPWPGNVRELQSVLKQAMLQATGPILIPEFLPAVIAGREPRDGHAAPPSPASGLPELTRLVDERLRAGSSNLHAEVLAVVERQLLLQVLHHTAGNQSQAARILGITRPTLRSKLAALGLSIERSTLLEEHASPGE